MVKLRSVLQFLFPFLLLFMLCGVASSSVDIYTLSPRSSLSLTIYQTDGLSLVQEQYRVNFKEGDNLLQFSWAGTRIDPSSIHIDFLQHPEKIKVEEITFPPDSSNLIWKIKSSRTVQELIKVSYFTGGLFWEASCTFQLHPENDMSAALDARISVENKSGKDYPEAKVRLVTGEPHLIEEKKERVLLKAAAEMRLAEEEAPSPPQITKQAVSEYHVYQIEDKIDLLEGEKSQFSLFSSTNIPVEVIYVFNFARWGKSPLVNYKFPNSKDFPLPSGPVQGWLMDGSTRIDYLGKGNFPYVPSGEEVQLTIGKEKKLKLKKKMIAFLREEPQFSSRNDLVQYLEKEEYLLSLENFLQKEAQVTVREEIPGEWSLVYSSIPVEKKEARILEFKLDIPGESKKQLTYAIKRVVRVR